jgi:hypothetical protein
MGLPKPPLDITGHCSAIHNETLFLFSPAGFQSIQLKQGAQWNVLPPGTSVQGGACVNANSGTASNPALYIVGGRANSTQTQFSGLQRFSYSTGQWENISPVVPVTQNRQGHGAAYLAQSGNIVVYAGSQDSANTNPSSQSFLISTVAPFNVISFTSLPPPLTLPMLMPWNESHALMVGGSAENKGLFLFGQQGWTDLGTTIPQPILSRATQCTLVTGDDGSKVLQEYNLGESPNQITRYLLFSKGNIVPAGTPVGAPKVSTRRRSRRDLTADNWPAYNATGAPTVARTDYSIAQGLNGVALISGGSDSTPLLLFNEKQNSWVDTGSVFGAQAQIPISNTSASASSTSSTATPSASASQAASKGKSNSHALTILGATLGAVLGLAAILILILICLKRSPKRSKSRQERRDAEDEKENRMSFADQGTEYMPSTKSGHIYGESVNDSVTSLQIFQGQIPGHRRAQNSDSSTAGLVNHKSPLGRTEPFEMGHIPRIGQDRIQSGATEVTQMNAAGGFGDHSSYAPTERAGQARSAGWSQYFNNNNNVTDLGAIGGSQPQPFQNDNNSYRSSVLSMSEYAETAGRNTDSASIKPLELNLGPKFDSARDSTYTTGTYGAGRAISTGSGYDTSHYSMWTDDRASQISSILPVPPIGSGPAFGNAFARPVVQAPTGNVAQPVPIPSPGAMAYGAEAIKAQSAETLNTRSSGGPPAEAQDFPMPKAYMPQMTPSSPKSPKSSSRGPVIRKMTGSEDMSWLNINAGRNS